jgi:AmiR/NasT family two-component response regulator
MARWGAAAASKRRRVVVAQGPHSVQETTMAKRVLIAEDNWLTPTVLRAELESHGFEVVSVARTGTEAVEQTEQTRPDVVLMDIQMPDLDGIQATRAIMEARPTCVVIVTGRAELSQVAEESGAMAYLVKPFMPDEIVTVVEEALQRYEWYRSLLAELPSPHDVLQAWPRIQKAVRAIADRDRASEGEAFIALRRTAAERGQTIPDAAQEVLASSGVGAKG